MTNNQGTYRPEIDGLRALAVGLVMLFHAFPMLAPGGFVGVDVFFVISGYLITGILLREMREERYSLIGFYARRFRRIMPALIVVLGATWIAGRVDLLAGQFANLGKYIAAAAGFVSNIVLWTEAGYFDTAATYKPLLHLWSLGVEEQFYLVWPLLLALSFRRGWTAGCIAVLLVASFVVNVATIGQHPAAAFYLLPARFWELLIGGALAYREFSGAATRQLPNVKAWVGVALIVGSAYALDPKSVFPGWNAVVPVLGSALLISAGSAAWVNRRILSSRVAVWTGLISYPLYLWHWPLLSIAHMHNDAVPAAGIRAGLMVAAVVLAWLTYRFVEKPIQRGTVNAGPVRLVTGSVAAMLVVGAVGAFTLHGHLMNEPQRQGLALMAYRSHDALRDRDGLSVCFLQPHQPATDFDEQCYAPTKGPTIMVVGDSFARRLYHGLREYFHGQPVFFRRLNASSCPPIEDIHRENAPNCPSIVEFEIEKVRELKPDVLVLQAIWYSDNGRDPDFFRKLESTIARFRDAGAKNIVVTGQLPLWLPTLPEMVEREYLRRGVTIPKWSREGIPAGMFTIDPGMEKNLAGKGVTFVPMMGDWCNADGCPVYVGPDLSRDLIAFDAGHLTDSGSDFAVRERLGPTIARLLSAQPAVSH